MARMLGFIESRDLWRHHPFHHAVGGLEDDHVQASLTASGRDFEADVATTDNDRAPARAEFGAQPIHIRDSSQVVHSGEFSSWEWQQTGMTARGQQQRVVLHRAAIGYFDAAPPTIDAHHGITQAQIDIMLRVMDRVPEQQAVAVERSGQILLRQGRALVRQRSLIADERDRASVTALAERLDRLCRSLPGADDGYSLIAHCVHTI